MSPTVQIKSFLEVAHQIIKLINKKIPSTKR